MKSTQEKSEMETYIMIYENKVFFQNSVSAS